MSMLSLICFHFLNLSFTNNPILLFYFIQLLQLTIKGKYVIDLINKDGNNIKLNEKKLNFIRNDMQIFE